MSNIARLGYIGCEVSDIGAWDNFLEVLCGLKPASTANPAERTYFLDQGRQHLAFRKSNTDRLAWIGWEVSDRETLHRVAGRLNAAGASATNGDETLCQERDVSDLVVTHGPDGERLELYVCDTREPRLDSTPLHLAHIVLASGDRRSAVQWYREVLGFLLSDDIFWDDGVEASFLRCNQNHHSLALSNLVGDMAAGDLNHFMIEASSLDNVGLAHDAMRRAGIPIAFTPGRHSNDLAFSFYAYTPSGWLVEFATGGRLIDDDNWEPRQYDTPSIWGHEHLPPPGGDPAKTRY